MTANELATALAAKINALAERVTASVVGDRIVLTSIKSGVDSGLLSASLSVNGSEVETQLFTRNAASLHVAPTELTFPAEGGVATVGIHTDKDWTVGMEAPSSDYDYSTTAARNVYNLAVETDAHRLIHFESRPISFDFGYAHIHRMVTMVRAILNGTDGDNLTAALYGSENLTQWTLLSYAYKKNVRISQIRTPSAAHSWRYYKIVAGGKTSPDTDFGPTILDYQPSIRRVG